MYDLSLKLCAWNLDKGGDVNCNKGLGIKLLILK